MWHTLFAIIWIAILECILALAARHTLTEPTGELVENRKIWDIYAVSVIAEKFIHIKHIRWSGHISQFVNIKYADMAHENVVCSLTHMYISSFLSISFFKMVLSSQVILI